jgi:nucleoside-diphosphate-sugar epimerase
MSRVLVTGANGFVGSVLCPLLAERGYVVRAALRESRRAPTGVAERVIIGGLDGDTQWSTAVSGVDGVIHLAARVHVSSGSAAGAAQFLTANTHGTRRLAEQAAQHGVRRLIYLSSVKVNGEETTTGAYSADDVPQPRDAYGLSKWRAEQALREAASATRMQAVIVRSPLVYGVGVRANFLRLLNWVDRERWLPLGSIHNRRSLVSVWALCDLLARLLDHPAAPDRTWMISDGDDVSTPELVRRIARAMGRRPRLFPIPPSVLRVAGGLVGKAAEMRRLCGSLVVDTMPARTVLAWSPPLSMEEALARTAAWYHSCGGVTGTSH